MNKFFKISRMMICFLVVAVFLVLDTSAHSGRTDSNGGHKDNRNVSGLGYYHYHCGGYPAHLHDGGYCPYTDIFPKNVTISLNKKELRLNEEIEIIASIMPLNSCNTRVTLESSNPAVVKLSGSKLIAVGYGTSVITASSFNGKSSSVNVSVKEVAVETVTINLQGVADQEFYVGDSIVLSATITPYDADNTTLTWSSSDTSVATVNDAGEVQAISSGTTEITATSYNGVVGKLFLNVQTIEVEKIKTTKETIDLKVGETAEIRVEIIPSNATYQEVVWASSDDAVVTVENGTVKAVGQGSATITVETSNGQKAEMLVSVSTLIEEDETLGYDSDFSESGMGYIDVNDSEKDGGSTVIIGGIAVVGIGVFIVTRMRKKGKR